MKDLKFRAWLLKTNRMVNVTGLCWQSKGLAVECLRVGWEDIDSKIAQEFWWNETECILLQGTGLIDFNGNEIFEGDIVERWNDFNYRVVMKSLREVWTLDKSARIIGNIYEQPELVK